jgi:hypothetical protein
MGLEPNWPVFAVPTWTTCGFPGPIAKTRSVWEDVECILRIVNFRRVSDSRRAFWPVLRVTGISDDCSDGKWGRVQSWVGYQVCLEWEALFCASQVMSRSACCWCVYYGGKRERRWRQEEGIYILEFWRYLGSTCPFCLLTNTKQPSIHLVEPHATSWITSLKTRISTCRENNLRCRVLLLHHILFLPFRPRASRSKLSSSQVFPTVQASNTATNALQRNKHSQLMS